jgi:uncharacterized protein YdhG (YjbR/CyaY superfamily)
MSEHPDREKQTYDTVEDYLAAASYTAEPRLLQMRAIIRDVLPHAEETMSHNLPSFYQHGVVVVQYAGLGEHTSLKFFPTAGVLGAFRSELAEFKTNKSGVRFSVEEPLPTELIKKIVAFRLDEAAKFAARKGSGS